MTSSLERYTERHHLAFDVFVAGVLFGLVVLGAGLGMPGNAPPSLGPALLLAGISSAALVGCRSHPRTAVAVTAACVAAASAVGYLLTPLLLAPVLTALYWLAVLTERKITYSYCLATIAALVTTATVADPVNHALVLKTIGPAVWLLLPVAAGRAVRIRRAYTDAVMDAAQARAEHAERTRDEEARHRVAEERMRIARELHDVVAHHLALANAQASTAAHLARNNPDQAHKILTGLASTTSSALRELKATVGLLRQTDDPDAPLEPSPGLARLPELTDAFASAGLPVTVTTHGEPRRLSPGVDLTAFRIVQEALTNVTKHAAAHTAHVRLSYSRDRLTIGVTDDGTAATDTAAAPAPGHGFGLIGMRERAHSVGGALTAGRRPEGGFEVTAELPLHPDGPAPAPEPDPMPEPDPAPEPGEQGA
ncbi:MULTISPECIES: sensor histidine kinase [Streptomyces]|uniref:histidine kinase n=1 Tax=Streptomyces lonegramiae TaxID=3075524 RepID=A0ABU2XKP7_9ACTN|nr:sensor histidine kinase [Streptomyces sp. DSM 41529]MDT0546499.1 sensor histidine kinase [Streptomyces sp. DSM 41529]